MRGTCGAGPCSNIEKLSDELSSNSGRSDEMPRKRQALIVENDADVTSELESLLYRLGFEVTRIQEPDRVEETIGNHVYEVALLNATLPDLSWRRTLRAVKNASRTTTVIMITRHAADEDIRVALNAGAYAAVERPLSQQQLTSFVSPHCDGLLVALRG